MNPELRAALVRAVILTLVLVGVLLLLSGGLLDTLVELVRRWTGG